MLPAKEKIHQFDLNSDSSRQESDRYYWSWSPKHIRPFEVQILDLINARNSGKSSAPVGITLQHMCKRSLGDWADLTASSCDNGKPTHHTQSSPVTDFSNAFKDQCLSFEQDMSIIDNEPNQNSIFSLQPPSTSSLEKNWSIRPSHYPHTECTYQAGIQLLRTLNGTNGTTYYSQSDLYYGGMTTHVHSGRCCQICHQRFGIGRSSLSFSQTNPHVHGFRLLLKICSCGSYKLQS